MQELRDRKIKSLESPSWLHCGREKNRFVHFEDGSNACARYRGPDHAEFIQGELMAFYLARLLGITNTPAVVLSEVSLFDFAWTIPWQTSLQYVINILNHDSLHIMQFCV